MNKEAKAITAQLRTVQKLNPRAIIDNTSFKEANKESYYARNTLIVENCDILFAFQVNNSKGVQDALNKARKLGKKVVVKKYTIQS